MYNLTSRALNLPQTVTIYGQCLNTHTHIYLHGSISVSNGQYHLEQVIHTQIHKFTVYNVFLEEKIGWHLVFEDDAYSLY